MKKLSQFSTQNESDVEQVKKIAKVHSWVSWLILLCSWVGLFERICSYCQIYESVKAKKLSSFSLKMFWWKTAASWEEKALHGNILRTWKSQIALSAWVPWVSQRLTVWICCGGLIGANKAPGVAKRSRTDCAAVGWIPSTRIERNEMAVCKLQCYICNGKKN